MPNKNKRIVVLLLSILITIPLYILLHELGHTIVILSAGGEITEFSIVTAHVSSTGGSYTDLSDLWLHANGALLPVIVSYTYMLLYKIRIQNMFYTAFSFMFSLMPISSLCAWVFIPFLYISGNAPEGDDVTLFLYNFSHSFSPLAVSVISVIIIAAGVIIMIKKKIIGSFIIMMKEQ